MTHIFWNLWNGCLSSNMNKPGMAQVGARSAKYAQALLFENLSVTEQYFFKVKSTKNLRGTLCYRLA